MLIGDGGVTSNIHAIVRLAGMAPDTDCMQMSEPRPSAVIVTVFVITGSALLIAMASGSGPLEWTGALVATLMLLALGIYAARALLGGKM